MVPLSSSLMATFLLFIFLSQTLMATQEQPKWKVELSAKITGPTADQVWPVIADFCNLYKMFPTDLSFCVEGVPGKPRQIRYSAVKSPSPSPSDGNTTIVLWAREELLAINPTKRYITYQILENNRGLKRFIGTMQVLPIDRYGCQFKWSVLSDPVDGYTYESFVAMLNPILEGTVEKIENLFGAN